MSDENDGWVSCTHCNERFDRTGTASVFDGSGQALYRCPHCSRWTHGPPPDA